MVVAVFMGGSAEEVSGAVGLAASAAVGLAASAAAGLAASAAVGLAASAAAGLAASAAVDLVVSADCVGASDVPADCVGASDVSADSVGASDVSAVVDSDVVSDSTVGMVGVITPTTTDAIIRVWTHDKAKELEH